MFASLFASGVLLPYRQEKSFLLATVFSALVNVILNFVLIPLFEQTAAAFTTLLAEVVALLVCFHYAKQYVSLKGLGKSLLLIGVGCLAIVGICSGIKVLGMDLYLETVICVAVSVVGYCLVQIILKNKDFTQMLTSVLNMFRKKHG